MTYILDFDGTIVDLWPRFYKVFCDINSISDVSFNDYKKVKRLLKKDELVARKLNVILHKDYFERKKEFLENFEYLKEDKLLVAKEDLYDFFAKYKCLILTKRRNKENFIKELKFLNIEIKKLEFEILSPLSGMTKSEWIRQNYFNDAITLIGDGEEEIKANVLPNVNVVIVDSGLTNIEELHNVCTSKSLSFFIKTMN